MCIVPRQYTPPPSLPASLPLFVVVEELTPTLPPFIRTRTPPSLSKSLSSAITPPPSLSAELLYIRALVDNVRVALPNEVQNQTPPPSSVTLLLAYVLFNVVLQAPPSSYLFIGFTYFSPPYSLVRAVTDASFVSMSSMIAIPPPLRAVQPKTLIAISLSIAVCR